METPHTHLRLDAVPKSHRTWNRVYKHHLANTIGELTADDATADHFEPW
jgi:hypothetical protein